MHRSGRKPPIGRVVRSLLAALIWLTSTRGIAAAATGIGSMPAAGSPDSLVLDYLKFRAAERSLVRSGPEDSTVLRRLGLDWPIQPWNGRLGWGVMVARSPAERYFVLIGVGYGEFGPGGDCHYCLLDSLGHKRWVRSGRMLNPPRVSDAGEVVLFEIAKLDPRPPSLIVRWLAADGAVVGEHAFGPFVARTNQRSGSAEIQLLDGDARSVYFTVNERPVGGSPPSAEWLDEVNNVRLIAMSAAGVVQWSYRLGGMSANGLDLALAGRRLVIDDLGEASVYFANVLIVLTSEGRLVRRILLEKNLRCYHPAMERNDRYVLFVDGSLRRMDTKTGEVRSGDQPDWLEEQASEWSADGRSSLARQRLNLLDRLRLEITSEKDADWPAYYRRWGHRKGR